MRLQAPKVRAVALLMGFALLSPLCGIPPQEGRVPHQQNPAPTDTAAPAPRLASPSASDSPRGVEGRASRGVEGRSPRRRPGPAHLTVDPRPQRLSQVNLYPGTRVVVPPAWNRCTSMPNLGYWRHRDLMAEIQWLSRRGFIPVTPLGDTVDALTDYTQQPAGWRAYGVAVPAGGTVQVEVQHPKIGWFRLMLVDKWGTPGPGMLQAAIAHQPVLVTYKNPGKEATAVYVIVDDPAWWSDAKEPYTLLVRRDWDPAKTDLSTVKMVVGLWGASPSVSAEFRGRSLTGPAVFPH